MTKQLPVNDILAYGDPYVTAQAKVQTATNMYPGRLAAQGSTIGDLVIGSGILKPLGVLGYKNTLQQFRPANRATIFTTSDYPALMEGHFGALLKLAAGVSAVRKDKLANWADGMVVPVAPMSGGLAIKIPFSKQTSAFDTITLPAGVIVKDVIVQVDTPIATATIDVGLKTTDPDGFVDGETCAAAGLIEHNMVDATAANITFGALLTEVEIKDATGTPVFYAVPLRPGYLVGAAEVLVYTTSNHDIAGFIWVVLEHPNFAEIGTVDVAADATAAAANVLAEVSL